MLHEHPLELADIKAGIAGRPPAGETLRRRQLAYYPVAGLLAVVLLFAVYGFVNGEQTAITTVPPQIATLPIYVPQTPTPLPPTPTALPSPTAAPTEAGTASAAASVTWAEVSPIFAARFGMCHSSTLATAGLNLGDYAAAIKGAQDGAVILPGDAANSKLILIQSAGGHPGQLSPEELALVRAWIEAGALEK